MADTLLAKAITRRCVMVALLKDEQAFERLVVQLKDAYTRAFSEAAQSAIVGALDRLREINPADFDVATWRSLMAQLEARMGGTVMRGVLAGPVVNLSSALFALAGHEVGQSVGVDIAFGQADLDALDMIAQGNLFWVQNSWSDVTQTRFNDALGEFFDAGMTRQQLMGALATSLGEQVTASLPYWELLADHAATKTREMGRVTAYERAGIVAVQVRAHLDARTTKICRSLHGRVITVSALSNQRSKYLNAVQASDKAAAKKAWKMYPATTAFNRDTSKLPADIGNPPYHFRCRTITVAYFDNQALQATPTDAAHWPASPVATLHDASFARAPALIKAAIFRHDGALNPVVAEGKSGSYRRDSRQITMAKGFDMASRQVQGTWMHEYGHFIDDALEAKPLLMHSRRGAFPSAMRRDSRRIKKNAGMGKGMGKGNKQLAHDHAAALDEVQARMMAATADTQQALLQTQIDALGVDRADVVAWLADDAVFSLDYAAGRLRVGRLLTALDRGDMLNFLKEYHQFDEAGMRGMMKRYSMYEKGLSGKFSDLIGSATRNVLGGQGVYGNGGHSNAYYRARGVGVQSSECFANITALLGSGSVMWQQVLTRFTPAMVEAYKEALK